MRLILTTPSRVSLVDPTKTQLDLARSYLTFHDKSVDYQIQQHKGKRYWKTQDPNGWLNHLDSLKSQQTVCILREPDDQDPYTFSGLAQELSQYLGGVEVVNQIAYPEPQGLAWEGFPFTPRPYQVQAKELLLGARHGAVELATGVGKSRIALELCHDLGLRSVVMAPSRNIAHQLYRDFVKNLGAKRVGMFGDGKKQLGKLITIGIAASLTKVEPQTEAWEWLSGAHLFISDESHLVPSTTFEKVCSGLLANAEYRFFFSGTQTRMDGSELLLRGITGPIVHRMSVQEGVDQGYLAKPVFKMIRIPSRSSIEPKDIQRLVRIHLLENPDVLDRACSIANSAVKLLGHQVLILIDELNQFRLIEPRLKHPCGFAHGQDNTAEAKRILPKAFQRSDPTDLVDRFNNNEFPILVGTSCISTGTDIQNVRTAIILTGGKSEIAIPQAVGRCTRRGKLLDGTLKSSCNVVDFAPMLNTDSYDDSQGSKNLSPVFRHALARSKIYRGIYDSLTWI
jgi:superfamily II DNA or RNA helicase